MLVKGFKFIGIVILILSLSFLVGCRKEKLEKPNPPVVGEDNEDKNDGLLIRDEEGLIEVLLEDGQPSISFKLDKWEELHKILTVNTEIYGDGDLLEDFFTIKTISGKVEDVCIGKIDSLGYFGYDFTIPVVVFMMDDGSLEWTYADPYMAVNILEPHEEEYMHNYYSFGKLPYKDDFASMSYETTKEGIGDKTIYIRNREGKVFDFRYLWIEGEIIKNGWACDMEFPGGDSFSDIGGFLHFYESGSLQFDIAFKDEEGRPSYYHENWFGSYELVKSLGEDYPLGSLIFDLDLVDWVYLEDMGFKDKIRTSYRADIVDGQGLVLYFNDGDGLYQRNKDLDFLSFTWHYENYLDGESILAYVRFDDYLEDGQIVLSIDDVLWISDPEEANDYRLENEEEIWVPYVADMHTRYSLYYIPENIEDIGPIQKPFMDMDSFVRDLQEHKNNEILAEIIIEDEKIINIRELYTP